MIVKLLITYFAIRLCLRMINRDGTTSSVSTIREDVLSDSKILNLNDFFFFLYARYSSNGTTIAFTESNSVFTISATQVSWVNLFTGANRSGSYTPISTETWRSSNNIEGQLEQLFNTQGPFIWFDYENMNLQGSRLTSEFQYVSITIDKWQNGTIPNITCEDQSVIDEAVSSLVVNAFVSDKYFDLQDYNEPIKQFYTDRNVYYAMTGFTNEARLYVQENEATMNDEYLI